MDISIHEICLPIIGVVVRSCVPVNVPLKGFDDMVQDAIPFLGAFFDGTSFTELCRDPIMHLLEPFEAWQSKLSKCNVQVPYLGVIKSLLLALVMVFYQSTLGDFGIRWMGQPEVVLLTGLVGDIRRVIGYPLEYQCFSS